jgi:hypothetical protein
MAPTTKHVPSRAEECFKSHSDGLLSQQLGSLSVTSRKRNPQTRRGPTSQSQSVASSRSQPTRCSKPHQARTSMHDDIQEAPFSGRVAVPANSRPGRIVKVKSSSSEGAELEWLPSTNRGSSEISIRVTAEMFIAPKSTYLVRDIERNHNNEVPKNFPRMRLRELGDNTSPDLWELIPLEKGLGPPNPESSGKSLLIL